MKAFDACCIEPEFVKCAATLQKQRRAVFPRIRYHLLADAIYWSDEIPRSLDADAEGALRFVLRYRTSLLVGRPEEEYDIFWLAAKRAFPNWIGFREDRCTRNHRLAQLLLRFQKRNSEELAPQ